MPWKTALLTMSTSSSNNADALVAGLNRLARNLWWTWNQEAQEIFQELAPSFVGRSFLLSAHHHLLVRGSPNGTFARDVAAQRIDADTMTLFVIAALLVRGQGLGHH